MYSDILFYTEYPSRIIFFSILQIDDRESVGLQEIDNRLVKWSLAISFIESLSNFPYQHFLHSPHKHTFYICQLFA